MEEPDQHPRGRLRDVAEDATGFDAAELRMTRDLLVRPHEVVTQAGHLDSPYPKPLRYYLTLTGLYLALIAILGGFESSLASLWTAAPDQMEAFIEMSGKSADSFRADLDQWYSFLVVPAIALANYPVLRFLFRRWTTGSRPGDEAFVFLSGFTLLAMVVGLSTLVIPGLKWLPLVTFLPFLFAVFLRMGRDVWWRTGGQLARRYLAVAVLLWLIQLPTMIVVTGLALAGAIFMP